MPSSFPLDSRGCGNDVICLIPCIKHEAGCCHGNDTLSGIAAINWWPLPPASLAYSQSPPQGIQGFGCGLGGQQTITPIKIMPGLLALAQPSVA